MRLQVYMISENNEKFMRSHKRSNATTVFPRKKHSESYSDSFAKIH